MPLSPLDSSLLLSDSFLRPPPLHLHSKREALFPSVPIFVTIPYNPVLTYHSWDQKTSGRQDTSKMPSASPVPDSSFHWRRSSSASTLNNRSRNVLHANEKAFALHSHRPISPGNLSLFNQPNSLGLDIQHIEHVPSPQFSDSQEPCDSYSWSQSSRVNNDDLPIPASRLHNDSVRLASALSELDTKIQSGRNAGIEYRLSGEEESRCVESRSYDIQRKRKAGDRMKTDGGAGPTLARSGLAEAQMSASTLI